MTNVPTEIREIWTDLYKLFDKHYQMKNTEEDWRAFWLDAGNLLEKGKQNRYLWNGINTIADYFGDRMKAEAKNGQ